MLLLTPIYAQEEIKSIYPTISELGARVTIYGKGVVNGLKEGETAEFQVITFNKTPFQSVKIVKDELNLGGTVFHPRIVKTNLITNTLDIP